MSGLVGSPFAWYIGMMLVHSLWQVTLVAVLFAFANRLLASCSASLRYLVGYAALLLMLLVPIATLVNVANDSRTMEDTVASVPSRDLFLGTNSESTASIDYQRSDSDRANASG